MSFLQKPVSPEETHNEVLYRIDRIQERDGKAADDCYLDIN